MRESSRPSDPYLPAGGEHYQTDRPLSYAQVAASHRNYIGEDIDHRDPNPWPHDKLRICSQCPLIGTLHSLASKRSIITKEATLHM